MFVLCKVVKTVNFRVLKIVEIEEQRIDPIRGIGELKSTEQIGGNGYLWGLTAEGDEPNLSIKNISRIELEQPVHGYSRISGDKLALFCHTEKPIVNGVYIVMFDE